MILLICLKEPIWFLLQLEWAAELETGAAHVIARAAKELNILTVGVVTLPFLYESPSRMRRATTRFRRIKKNM